MNANEQTLEWVGDAFEKLLDSGYLEFENEEEQENIKHIMTTTYRQSREYKNLEAAKDEAEYLVERIRWALGESIEDTRPAQAGKKEKP